MEYTKAIQILKEHKDKIEKSDNNVSEIDMAIKTIIEELEKGTFILLDDTLFLVDIYETYKRRMLALISMYKKLQENPEAYTREFVEQFERDTQLFNETLKSYTDSVGYEYSEEFARARAKRRGERS